MTEAILPRYEPLPEWHGSGACSETETPQWWDVDATSREHVQAAVVCSGCVVADLCLADARADTGSIGVRGGHPFGPAAEGSRRRHRRQRESGPLLVAEPLSPHGTHSAFIRHRSDGSDPCMPCWEAERKYQRDRKRRTRAAERVTS
jgi:hypothetical protein